MCPLALDETDFPITWTWCLKCGLINLVAWILFFAMLFLLAYYTLDVPDIDTMTNGLDRF